MQINNKLKQVQEFVFFSKEDDDSSEEDDEPIKRFQFLDDDD